MAEELQDAAYSLPRIIVWATFINGGMMFVMCITICYCIGDLSSGRSQLCFVQYQSSDNERSPQYQNWISIHTALLQFHRFFGSCKCHDVDYHHIERLQLPDCYGRLFPTAIRIRSRPSSTILGMGFICMSTKSPMALLS
jgi:hypothetical protein